MDQRRCDFATLSRHRPEAAAGDSEKFGWFQGNHISWRSYKAGIWQYASNVPWMPLNGFVRAGPAIDEQGQPSGKNDVKSLHRVVLAAQYVASIQVAHGSVDYQPRQLCPGSCTQGPVCSQPIDEISCYHRLNISKLEAGDSLTRYQREMALFLLRGGLGRLFLRGSGFVIRRYAAPYGRGTTALRGSGSLCCHRSRTVASTAKLRRNLRGAGSTFSVPPLRQIRPIK